MTHVRVPASVQALDLTVVMTRDDSPDAAMAIVNALPLQVGPSAIAECQSLL